MLHIKIFGIVQGVGFRPFVAKLSAACDIKGTVANKGPYVEIFAVGEKKNLAQFLHDLRHKAPERANITKIDAHETTDRAFDAFSIIESEKERGDVLVSPDIAICEQCRAELFDPRDRRYLHPFINCTQCGPRLTITEAVPYDRCRTSMGDFPMCEKCAAEYRDFFGRRYDAQPVCCNECGPEVYIVGKEICGNAAITYARKIIAQGGTVAVKGIGGFHLACDATNEAAVVRLRKLKRRPVKPFAVMLRDMLIAKRECEFGSAQEKILDSPQKPILLLPRKKNSAVAESVARENPKLGIMLPYAPLQLLLFAMPDGEKVFDALVMTSGNPSGAPIAKDDEEVAALLPLCDAILSHNRRIRIRADDSVTDFVFDKAYMIRRSRGYAPLPVEFADDFKGEVLAFGGELKNSFCLAKNDLFYLSPYIGDMTDIRSLDALGDSVKLMQSLLEITPRVAACDPHPAYHTTNMAKSSGLPLFFVHHHHAHILSCMAENGEKNPVIGVAFDGTGYGDDGAIWGGEIMIADFAGFRRIGAVDVFLHAGGDKAARECWRSAVSLIFALGLTDEEIFSVAASLNLAAHAETKAQLFLLRRKLNTVPSTSAGRLFDAVSAILGIRRASTFEGEAAMYLEYAALNAKNDGSLPPPMKIIDNGKIFTLSTLDLFRRLLRRKLDGDDTAALARDFHVSLADGIALACEKARAATGLNTVALSGGVFQNTLLTTLTTQKLREKNFAVLLHSLVPPNDGGIALGQAAAAMYALKGNKIC